MQQSSMPTIEHHRTGGVTLTFPASDDDFGASLAAEAYLKARGFSVGRRQGTEPRGILYGAIDIRKWRDLSHADVLALHGRMSGDGRHGPVIVEIDASAPLFVQRAICGEPREAPTGGPVRSPLTDVAAMACLALVGLSGLLFLPHVTAPAAPRLPVIQTAVRLPGEPKIALRALRRPIPVLAASAEAGR